MKKIYESPLNGWDESAEKIHVYALDENDDWFGFYEMTKDELCEYFGVREEPDYAVAPGGLYHRYDFKLTSTHIIMIEKVAYNV